MSGPGGAEHLASGLGICSRRTRLAKLATVFAVAAILVLGAFPCSALGASPEPTAAPQGDTRSAGEGPGLVGQPLLAVTGVVALGLVAAGLTVVYVRATGGPRADDPTARVRTPSAGRQPGSSQGRDRSR